MLGFSTEDVREMFTYYKEKGMMRPDSNIEEIIEEMKPWYDNYCFPGEPWKLRVGCSTAIWCSISFAIS